MKCNKQKEKNEKNCLPFPFAEIQISAVDMLLSPI